MRTVWVLGDQLNRDLGAMSNASPDDTRVLLVESRAMIEARRFHRQRLHLVVSSMRRLGRELTRSGFQVDYRRAASLTDGVGEHRRRFQPHSIVATDPRRATSMVAGAAASNLAYGLALYGAVAAFGPAAPPLGVVVAYLVAATVASIAPTPGGLGAMEAALISALTRLAVPGGQAVAATVAFRLATFWLPLAIGSIVLHRLRHRGMI